MGYAYLASVVELLILEGGSIHRLTYNVLVEPNVGINPNLLPLLFGRSMVTGFVSLLFRVTGLYLSCQAMCKLIGSLA
jgi:hypothetical protein